MAEWPFHPANQKLVVRLDWLFLASLSKILGLGEGRLQNESSINCMGKLKSRYTKAGLLEGRANNYKKAIVTLKEGDKIDFYSNI